jgi:hypothetical protein
LEDPRAAVITCQPRVMMRHHRQGVTHDIASVIFTPSTLTTGRTMYANLSPTCTLQPSPATPRHVAPGMLMYRQCLTPYNSFMRATVALDEHLLVASAGNAADQQLEAITSSDTPGNINAGCHLAGGRIGCVAPMLAWCWDTSRVTILPGWLSSEKIALHTFILLGTLASHSCLDLCIAPLVAGSVAFHSLPLQYRCKAWS